MRCSTPGQVASMVGRFSSSLPLRTGISTATRRSYATEAPRSRLGATLSLDHFLQRTKVLALYRTILRGTGHIKDATTKAETRSFARAEFERHRGVTDLGHIRYLLSTGKTEWETMERYIGGM